MLIGHRAINSSIVKAQQGISDKKYYDGLDV
jgi:hypothetical protein